MIIKSLDDVTTDALAAMARTEDPRLREIMTALVRHLHAFVREVRLTEAEFRAEIRSLKTQLSVTKRVANAPAIAHAPHLCNGHSPTADLPHYRGPRK